MALNWFEACRVASDAVGLDARDTVVGGYGDRWLALVDAGHRELSAVPSGLTPGASRRPCGGWPLRAQLTATGPRAGACRDLELPGGRVAPLRRGR